MRKDSTTKKQLQKTNSYVFWFVTIVHYLMGLAGLFFATRMAIANDQDERLVNGLIAGGFTVLFALTQPDMRFRKMVRGWGSLTKKYSSGKSKYSSTAHH